MALDEAALRAAVEWSIRNDPDFRLPDKALDLVDQACATARFRTLTPQVEEENCGGTRQSRPAAGRGSHVGRVTGDKPDVSPNEAIVQRAQDAIRRHLRPELVNRLTKVVHCKPLGMKTAREIPGKLVRELNDRLADAVIAAPPALPGGETPPARPAAGRGSHAHVCGVTVEPDESAEEWILRDGFSEKHGARNLEQPADPLANRRRTFRQGLPDNSPARINNP
ncbi:MAG: hypothetical protein NTW21_32025 [Verrucomicrobia bacterium]|nr:hypothetical protein [Verrucomicrobiota bacterium]